MILFFTIRCHSHNQYRRRSTIRVQISNDARTHISSAKDRRLTFCVRFLRIFWRTGSEYFNEWMEQRMNTQCSEINVMRMRSQSITIETISRVKVITVFWVCEVKRRRLISWIFWRHFNNGWKGLCSNSNVLSIHVPSEKCQHRTLLMSIEGGKSGMEMTMKTNNASL